ncbi:MAG: pilus assembly protein PilP [Deltaproteobacteria bacterium]|nr:pilus assembly protein PilP [Deltaproteobacteria bacterium]
MKKLRPYLLAAIFLMFVGAAALRAQEEATPSHKTKEALDKFKKAPGTIGSGLSELMKTGKDRLQKAFETKAPVQTKTKEDTLTLPEKRERTQGARYSPAGKRDPFRRLQPKVNITARPKENLMPLEKYELGQVKFTGIIWNIKEAKGIVEVVEEDNIPRGYIVQVGTLIGPNGGTVKAIKPGENVIVIQETTIDHYGARKKRECKMTLSKGGCS